MARAEPARADRIPARKPRGAVVRSGGAVVRRISTYVDLATFERVKARAGDTSTVSEVMAAALRAFLGPARPARVRRT